MPVSYDVRSEPGRVIVDVHLAGTDASGLSAEVLGNDTLLVTAATRELLKLSLPSAVQPDEASVKFSKKAQRLTFSAPTQSPAPSSDPAAASCPSASPTSTQQDRQQCKSSNGRVQAQSPRQEQSDIELLREMYGDELVFPPTATTAPDTRTSDQQPPPALHAQPSSTQHPTTETHPAPCQQPTTASDNGSKDNIAAQPAPVQSRGQGPSPASTAAAVKQPESDHDTSTSGSVARAQSLDCTNLALLLSKATQKAARDSNASAKKSAKADKKAVSSMLQSIASHLEQHQYVVCDSYIPLDMVIEARKELKVMEDHYEPGEIWVGKDADVGATIARRDVRGDKVLWLYKDSLEATSFVKDGVQKSCSFRAMKAIVKSIDLLVSNRLPLLSPQLRNVRERTEVMCAVYPGGGARFAKHIDNTANDGRRLTLLCYLNPNWKEPHGGALRLFPPDAAPVDVYPHCGRLAMFLSKTVAHEVMPTVVPRHSFTLWYYDAIERAESIAIARGAHGGVASAEAQQAARDLLRDILAGDTGAEGAIEADEEGVALFQQRVRDMPAAHRTHALSILAAVTGLASAQAFQDSVNAMTPANIAELRHSLCHMGLDITHNPVV